MMKYQLWVQFKENVPNVTEELLGNRGGEWTKYCVTNEWKMCGFFTKDTDAQEDYLQLKNSPPAGKWVTDYEIVEVRVGHG